MRSSGRGRPDLRGVIRTPSSLRGGGREPPSAWRRRLGRARRRYVAAVSLPLTVRGRRASAPSCGACDGPAVGRPEPGADAGPVLGRRSAEPSCPRPPTKPTGRRPRRHALAPRRFGASTRRAEGRAGAVPKGRWGCAPALPRRLARRRRLAERRDTPSSCPERGEVGHGVTATNSKSPFGCPTTTRAPLPRGAADHDRHPLGRSDDLAVSLDHGAVSTYRTVVRVPC